jgi:hypothetical protein
MSYARLGERPDAFTETLSAAGPWEEESSTEGVVIVNDAVAKSGLPSEPVAFTV